MIYKNSDLYKQIVSSSKELKKEKKQEIKQEIKNSKPIDNILISINKCDYIDLQNDVKEMKTEIKELKSSIKELTEMMKAVYEFEDV
jgi:HAMP domain-containing protein